MVRLDQFWTGQEHKAFAATLERMKHLSDGEYLTIYRCPAQWGTSHLHDYLELLRQHGIDVARAEHKPFGYRMPMPDEKNVGERELQIFRRCA